jgi:hypothetical protein
MTSKAGERGMLTNYLYPEELLLEMRIDTAIRDVLVRYRGTAWKVMEYDILPALNLHKYLSSINNFRDIGKEQASKEWLEIMHNKSNLAEAEKPAEQEIRKVLWEQGEKAWNMVEKRVSDLNKHRYYLGEWLKNDVGRESAANDWVKKYTWYRSKELMKIEYDYKDGMYDEVESKMYDFVKKHKDEIMDIAEYRSHAEYTRKELAKIAKEEQETKIMHPKQQRKHPLNLLQATHLLLFEKKTVGATSEMRLQMEEIAKEAYITGNPDYEAVMRKWAQEHAKAWRDHYAYVLEFILRTQEEKFLSVLTGKSPAECYGTSLLSINQ